MCDENQYPVLFKGAKTYICKKISTIDEEKSTPYII